MLAIVGGKGGCGKTTTALALARALADRGLRPVVVDADCDMPNLHTRADVPREPGVDALADGASLSRAIHRPADYPSVDVVPAGTTSGPVEPAALRRLARIDGPVVLDCPAGATEGVAAPVRAADRALVVSTAVPASLADGIKTAALARALDTPLAGAVVTRAPDDALTECSPFGGDCPVRETVPPLSGDPLASATARAAYDRLARGLYAERNV